MNFYKPLFLCLGIIITCRAAAQQDSLPGEDTTTVFSRPLPAGYLDKVSAKADLLEQKLNKRSTKALQQWQKQEARIKNKLAKKDSLKAIALFGDAQQRYQQLEQKLQNKTSSQQYIPGLDTLRSSLKFLQQNPQLLSNAKEAKKKLSDAIAKVNGMEEKFQQAEEIKKFIKERKQLFKERLGQLGFAKEHQ